MEGDLIRINDWLLPLSWLYGLGTGLRNKLFDWGILKSKQFNIPVISVGNITVGGTGKTPFVEYLVRLLKPEIRVAVLSRGYKRKSRGFVLAEKNTPMREIGDEPFQMKSKYPDIVVAVDKDRCRGVDVVRDCEDDVGVVILDDAYQHRYIRPGVNILLVDYHRLIVYDKLLPAGRLRESKEGKQRADIVVVTKCPPDLKPMSFRVIKKVMDLYPYQDLYFTTLEYGRLRRMYGGKEKPLEQLSKDMNVLLLTGIASPKQMMQDLTAYTDHITPLTFGDHHQFTPSDAERIHRMFASLPKPRMIITTEKDECRLKCTEGLNDEVKQNLYVLPIEVKFMLNQENEFNDKIISYVRKNKRNSSLD